MQSDELSTSAVGLRSLHFLSTGTMRDFCTTPTTTTIFNTCEKLAHVTCRVLGNDHSVSVFHNVTGSFISHFALRSGSGILQGKSHFFLAMQSTWWWLRRIITSTTRKRQMWVFVIDPSCDSCLYLGTSGCNGLHVVKCTDLLSPLELFCRVL